MLRAVVAGCTPGAERVWHRAGADDGRCARVVTAAVGFSGFGQDPASGIQMLCVLHRAVVAVATSRKTFIVANSSSYAKAASTG